MFFDILLHSASKGEHISLEQSSSEMLDSYDISITKQSIDAKFNESAVKFMQTILSKQISNQIDCNINPDFFKHFESVKIKDATRFDLPDEFEDKFKGYGGKNCSASAICIQYEYA